jgi:signal peptidase II
LREAALLGYPRDMSLPSAKKLDTAWLRFSPLFVLLLAADQLSKWWAVQNLSLHERVDLGFSLSYNTGIAFGFHLPQWLIFLLIFGILCGGTYLVLENKLWRDKWHLTGLAFLLAGALGNLIDRIRIGSVVDFIKIYFWPTFNLADAFIVIAMLIFAWIIIVREDALVSS